MRLSSTNLVAFFVTCSIVLLALPTHAQQRHWVEKLKADRHWINQWPEPFAAADRQALRVPFEIMIQNGWQRQNTLGSNLFHPQTQEVSDFGKRQLRRILLQHPENRRQVFVEQGETKEVTGARVDSVQQSIAAMFPNRAQPTVLQARRGPVGTAASTIDAVYRKFNASIEEPRLPPDGGGFTAGS